MLRGAARLMRIAMRTGCNGSVVKPSRSEQARCNVVLNLVAEWKVD